VHPPAGLHAGRALSARDLDADLLGPPGGTGRPASGLRSDKAMTSSINLRNASGSASRAGTTSTDRMRPRVDGISSNRHDSPVKSGGVPGGAFGTANSPRFIAASAQPRPPPEKKPERADY